MIEGDSRFGRKDFTSKYTEKLKEVLETVQKKIDDFKDHSSTDFSSINQSELAAEIDRNISILHKYSTRLAEEKTQLYNYEKKMKTVEGELFHYYRFDWDRSTKLTESAISKYVEGHECHLELSNIIKLQKTLITYIENIIDIAKNRNFSIKNLIDLRKMELNIN